MLDQAPRCRLQRIESAVADHEAAVDPGADEFGDAAKEEHERDADEDVVKVLRSTKKPVLLIANKVDDSRGEADGDGNCGPTVATLAAAAASRA